MAFFTYLMASGPYGTPYCGHTDAIGRRAWEHREGLREGFTRKYGVHRLVWFEAHDTREGAKARERRIKKWNRIWKIRLIHEMNPHWQDLYEVLLTDAHFSVQEWLENLPPNPDHPRESGDPANLKAPPEPPAPP